MMQNQILLIFAFGRVQERELGASDAIARLPSHGSRVAPLDCRTKMKEPGVIHLKLEKKIMILLIH